MKIVKTYSHMNSEEYLIVHHQSLYNEIKKVISNVDAQACKTKVNKEKKMPGKVLYSPTDLNASFKQQFESLSWKEARYSYCITLNRNLMLASLDLPAADQKKMLESNGEQNPIYSYNHNDFVKEKVVVEV